jgi:hypothetical protein
MAIISNSQHHAIDQFISIISSNWDKFNSRDWQYTFKQFCYGMFANIEPDVIVKSAWYVVEEIETSYPPSMGLILKKTKEIIGSGRAKNNYNDCERCNKGRRMIVFWLYENVTNRHVKHTAACACDCDMGKRQQQRLKLKNIYSFVAKLEDHPRLIKNRIWFQTKKDEMPTLEIEKYDYSNFRAFVPERNTPMKEKYQELLLRLKENIENNTNTALDTDNIYNHNDDQ